MILRNISILIVGAVLLTIQGCAPSSYPINEPTLSTNVFEPNETKSTLAIIDGRELEPSSKFSGGTLNADLLFQGKVIDEIAYLSAFSVKELNARGINVENSAQPEVKVDIETFAMKNHRTNGFTPFITFTMLKAKVHTEHGTKPIAVYIKRGKVPVWSFDEIVEPTLNQPLSLLVQEFSAKLNNLVYQQRVSDESIASLISKIKGNLKDGSTYLDVYQLGFSNNKTALPILRELTSSNNGEYVRLAAISSLGILQDEDSLELLQTLSQEAKTWSDRAMALKAIGDIGSVDALSYLQVQLEKHVSGKSKEDRWNTELINLYIQ